MASEISPFQQYESNEALLLMYLAGELSLEDRREVDMALAADASLAKQLASLRELQGSIFGKLAALDGRADLANNGQHETQAARAAGRWVAAAVRRQVLQPASNASAYDASRRRLIVRRVRLAAAVAAAIALGVLVWRGVDQPPKPNQKVVGPNIVTHDDMPPAPGGIPTATIAPTAAEDRMVTRLDHSFDGSAEAACQTLALSNSGPLFGPGDLSNDDNHSDGN